MRYFVNATHSSPSCIRIEVLWMIGSRTPLRRTITRTDSPTWSNQSEVPTAVRR